MLKIRLRVSPWSARCSPRSEGRATWIRPSSFFTSMSRATRSWSSPLGPLTLTSSGSMVTSTPSGRSMGCLPIRLIGPVSPNPRHQLAAHARAARVVAGHHAARGGDDRGAHAAEDLGHVVGADVPPATRPGEPLDAADHRLAVLGVLQPHAKGAADPGRLDRELLDVALLVQDARQLRL